MRWCLGGGWGGAPRLAPVAVVDGGGVGGGRGCPHRRCCAAAASPRAHAPPATAATHTGLSAVTAAAAAAAAASFGAAASASPAPPGAAAAGGGTGGNPPSTAAAAAADGDGGHDADREPWFLSARIAHLSLVLHAAAVAVGRGRGGGAAGADLLASPSGAAVAVVAAVLTSVLDVAAVKMHMRLALLRRAVAGGGAAAAVATATSGSADTCRSDGAAAAAAALDGHVSDPSRLFHAYITPWALPWSEIAALLVAYAPTERSVVRAVWANLAARLPDSSGVNDREPLAGAGTTMSAVAASLFTALAAHTGAGGGGGGGGGWSPAAAVRAVEVATAAAAPTCGYGAAAGGQWVPAVLVAVGIPTHAVLGAYTELARGGGGARAGDHPGAARGGHGRVSQISAGLGGGGGGCRCGAGPGGGSDAAARRAPGGRRGARGARPCVLLFFSSVCARTLQPRWGGSLRAASSAPRRTPLRTQKNNKKKKERRGTIVAVQAGSPRRPMALSLPRSRPPRPPRCATGRPCIGASARRPVFLTPSRRFSRDCVALVSIHVERRRPVTRHGRRRVDGGRGRRIGGGDGDGGGGALVDHPRCSVVENLDVLFPVRAKKMGGKGWGVDRRGQR